MKVWVCYKYWPYEGCSEPLAVFDNEAKALAWQVEAKKECEDANYEMLEVE